jgi:hypothetical protein
MTASPQPTPSERPPERRRIGAALHRVMEAYADDYPNKAHGLVQEAIQNAIDARATPLGFKDVAITIRYDPQSRILSIRDHGTTGMSHCGKCEWGLRKDAPDGCHEKDCKWGNFHYLGGESKTSGSLGYRGMGKSLMLVAGERLTVRTTVAPGITPGGRMASQWDRQDEDWYWTPKPEAAPGVASAPGSEFIVEGVKDEQHHLLQDSDSIRTNIGLTWFPAIEKGVRIRFGYNENSLERVGSFRFPDVEVGPSNQKVIRQRASIPVTVGRQIVGELTDLELRLARDVVPEELRGIALVRNGSQVIERISSWGRKLPPELQDRLYGWVSYETSEERPFLHICEKPGHRGFSPHPFYRRVKELLQAQVEDFLLPFAKATLKPNVTEKDRKRAALNLSIIQKALEEIPDFNPWSGEGTTPRHREKLPPPDHPYISRLALDKESYARGDVVKASVVILNPTAVHQSAIHLTIEALDPGLSQLVVQERPAWELPLLGPSHGDEKGRIECDVEIPITQDFLSGRNWIRATLFNRPRSPSAPNDAAPISETLWDRFGHALWIEETPKKHRRAAPMGGDVGEHGKQGTLNQLIPITAPLDPIEQEIIPMWTQGELWFNTKGVRIGPVYEGNPRTADSILYELSAEQLGDRILELKMDNDVRISLEKDAVIEEMKSIDALRRRFLQVCERIRSTQSV